MIAERRVRIAPGRHRSPGEGACVVELASLIAREPFSDQPQCVCSVIAAFLRSWNDRAAYADRQRLRPYAARIVGTRTEPRVTRERRDLCLEWVGADLRHGRPRRAMERLGMRVRIALFCGLLEALRLNRGAGEYAARVLFGRRDAEGAFLLLDAMLALGSQYAPRYPATPAPGSGAVARRSAPAPRLRPRPRGGGRGRNLGAPTGKMRLTFGGRSRFVKRAIARDDAGSRQKAHNVELWTRP